jgi:lipopolysaccharide transport system ATP-binding protein
MTAIKVENLGKSYLVGHNNARAESYTALRDVHSRNAHNLARMTRDRLTGRQIVQGNEVNEFWALKYITTKSSPGDNVDIIGRNGAGKSTLLKIFSPTVRPKRSAPLNI